VRTDRIQRRGSSVESPFSSGWPRHRLRATCSSATFAAGARLLPTVTIPAGRSAAVQSNFLMRHCDGLASGRTLVVDGSLFLSYRASGHADRQNVGQRSARILLTRGPTIRRCTRVSGSVRIAASDIFVQRGSAIRAGLPSLVAPDLGDVFGRRPCLELHVYGPGRTAVGRELLACSCVALVQCPLGALSQRACRYVAQSPCHGPVCRNVTRGLTRLADGCPSVFPVASSTSES